LQGRNKKPSRHKTLLQESSRGVDKKEKGNPGPWIYKGWPEGKKRPFSRNLQEGLTRRKKETLVHESTRVDQKEKKTLLQESTRGVDKKGKGNPGPWIYKGWPEGKRKPWSMNLQGMTSKKRRPFSRNLLEELTRRKKENPFQESPSIICKKKEEK
jgi:hypothetical protein